MTLVERTLEKMRRAQQKAPETRAVGALVREPVQAEEGAAACEAETPAKPRIHIDRDALRASGYLPESSRDRQFADQYRMIKRPLVAKAFGPTEPDAANPRIIMMASALPGDGKTFTSINLAMSLARERDTSVVLVDADVPKPHVSRIFGVEKEPGLIEAIADASVDVDSLLLPTDMGSLSILPAGQPSDTATEMLSSARMSAVVSRLLSRNPRRVLLFDSPPLLVSSESRALAAIAGQIVLVVRSGKTPRQAVLDALEQLGEEKDLSLVLNQGRVGHGVYQDYGQYGGGYGSVTESDVAPD
jgi:exopolysaccharide/PEP-CTERM locus tyrosine autokinase